MPQSVQMRLVSMSLYGFSLDFADRQLAACSSVSARGLLLFGWLSLQLRLRLGERWQAARRTAAWAADVAIPEGKGPSARLGQRSKACWQDKKGLILVGSTEAANAVFHYPLCTGCCSLKFRFDFCS